MASGIGKVGHILSPGELANFIFQENEKVSDKSSLQQKSCSIRTSGVASGFVCDWLSLLLGGLGINGP